MLTPAELARLHEAVDKWAASLGAAAPAAPPATVAPQFVPVLAGVDTSGWRLTFDEPFDMLDLARWSTVYPWNDRNGLGSSLPPNHEAQWFINDRLPLTAAIKPWRVSGGELALIADRMPAALKPKLGYDQADLRNLGAYDFTSGALHTKGTFAQTYGYFEVEAKLPAGRGLWPAFWMLPEDERPVVELDVFEVLGHEPARLYTTAHSPALGASPHIEAWFDPAVYHRFGLLWRPEVITLFIDGKPAGGGAIPTPPDMHSPMYLLLDLAVGGKDSWPGPPDAATKFPAEMRVRSVRAWSV